jgi:cardiolipin synthase
VRPRALAAALVTAALLAACGGTVAPSAPASAVATNSEATLFVEPDDGPEPLLAELNEASRSIDLTMYLLTDKPMIAALEAAARRGTQVRVLLEQHPFGAGQGNEPAYAALQRAGVAVRWTGPRFRLTHEKAVVIDGREALILTLNLTASAFTRNREYGVIDRTPEDVAEVAAIFNADWNRAPFTPSRPDLVVSPDNARMRLMALIGQASRQLDLESEEVQDPGLDQALTAAARRGVTVRVVLSPPASGPDSNAKGVQQLQAGGVQVHSMRKPYVHAKIFVVDGQTAFAGSENISTQSLDGNRELGLFLSQPEAVARMRTTFEADWGSKS